MARRGAAAGRGLAPSAKSLAAQAKGVGALGQELGGAGQDRAAAASQIRTMTTTTSSPRRLARALAFLDRHPRGWLVLGVALTFTTHLRFGLGVFAFVAALPFLRHVRVTEGWPSRVALVVASIAGWTLAMAKIITAPLPLAFAPVFAVPIGVLHALPYALVPAARRRFGEGVTVVAFSAWMVSAEWVLHALLPFGTWGAAAHTQLDRLALLQLASITGLHGVSFLVYLVAASLESLLASPTRRRVVRLFAVAGVMLASVAWGQARLARATARGAERVRLAAVGTDSTIGIGPLPTEAELAAVEAGLFERTRAAARSGASMAVWTEAATLVHPDGEEAFLGRVGALAREQRIAVVAGYIVPLSLEPLRYRNRYALLTPSGHLHHVYDKHHPVPGEPATPSRAPVPLYTQPELGRVSGALCYDYDFPRLGLAHALAGVDLVALPSSDWRGIDPIHTEMATLRAIEGGHSVLRSTRFGLSAGIDPHGRVRGWLSHWDDGDRVLVVSLPRHGTRTLYGTLGDWFPISCLVLGGIVAAGGHGRWYARGQWWPRSSPSRAEPSSTHASASGSMAARS